MFESTKSFKSDYTKRMLQKYGVSISESHVSERYDILGEMVRDYANVDWKETHHDTVSKNQKTLIYFSMEFLMGRMLNNNIQNLGLYKLVKDGLQELGPRFQR